MELHSRFPRAARTELARAEPEAWTKESSEIATNIAYQNGALRATPQAQQNDCHEVSNAAVLPPGYAAMAKRIAERRIMLAAHRLANLLQRISVN